MGNLGYTELLIVAAAIALLVAWIMGVAKLFTKGHHVLGIVALVGIVFPVVALVGYAGWFVEDRTAATT